MERTKRAERKECGPTVGEIRLSQYAFVIHVIIIMQNVPQDKKALAVNSCRDILNCGV